MLRRLVALSLACALAQVASAAAAGAQSATGVPPAPGSVIPMSLRVDTSDVARGYVHVAEHVAAKPGPLTLAYPKWIPGEHAPSGPLANVATLEVRANGRRLDWTRDPVALYEVHVDVPPDATGVDVTFDYLAANAGNYSSARLATPNMLTLAWNKVVIYPLIDDVARIEVTPTLVLPAADYAFGTALTTASRSGATVAFAPAQLNVLVDSPVDAGTNERTWPLGSIAGAPVALDVFADTPEELAATPKQIDGYRALVAQMAALYGARHFDHYTFLLTLSDAMPGNGVEHHQSSDDGVDGDFLTNPKAFTADATLLAHEFNHSWDGKYRRPADLARTNFQDPESDDLLWVYEGMTEHYGELQTERAGLRTKQQWLDSLAATWAQLDASTGRLTRPLGDTATSGPFLYSAPRQLRSARRGVDFYAEGEMMWILADETIRARTGGKKTLDDVTRAFFGRSSTGPVTKVYTRPDVVGAMSAALPYDWSGFFTTWIDAIAPHPPDVFAHGGWKLVYTAKPTDFYATLSAQYKLLDARYSLGIAADAKGVIDDVLAGSPAERAGLGVGGTIVALDGRALGGDAQQQLDDALVAHEKNPQPLRVLVLGGGTYADYAIPYRGGPRFPRLERVEGTPDLLSAIAKPL